MTSPKGVCVITLLFGAVTNNPKKESSFGHSRESPGARPGAQNRYVSQWFSLKRNSFSIPAACWSRLAFAPAHKITLFLMILIENRYYFNPGRAESPDHRFFGVFWFAHSAWICVPLATFRVTTRNREARFFRRLPFCPFCMAT